MERTPSALGQHLEISARLGRFTTPNVYFCCGTGSSKASSQVTPEFGPRFFSRAALHRAAKGAAFCLQTAGRSR